MIFKPKPWAIIAAILGIMGVFYFITRITDSWYSYGITCCRECKFLTFLIIGSIIAIIIGIKGNFKQNA